MPRTRDPHDPQAAADREVQAAAGEGVRRHQELAEQEVHPARAGEVHAARGRVRQRPSVRGDRRPVRVRVSDSSGLHRDGLVRVRAALRVPRGARFVLRPAPRRAHEFAPARSR